MSCHLSDLEPDQGGMLQRLITADHAKAVIK
jgi:hypothetical protein